MNRLLSFFLFLFSSLLSHVLAMLCRTAFIISVVFLRSSLPAHTQDEPPPKVSFGIGGGVGGRGLGKTPYVQNYGIELLKYAGKPQEAWGGGYYALTESGKVVEVKFAEIGLEGLGRLSILKPDKSGWLLNFNYAWARYSYSFDNTPFKYKGYTLGRRNGDMESWAFQFGVAKMWSNGFLVRMNGLYFDYYTIGPFNRFVNKNYRQEFVENGTGFLINVEDKTTSPYALMPEIGFGDAQYPVEIAIAAVIPFSQYAYTEQYAFYQNRRLIGGATASYSNFRLMFTLRLGLPIFNSKRSYNEPRYKPTPRREEPKVISTVPTGKFSDVAINRPVTLQNIYFEQSKADLLPQSNAELDEVTQWMRQNANVSIRLEGHTDKIGDADKNLQLSRERVNAVREYLIVKGISGMRIEVKGYGDTRLVCPSPCDRNRRVEMVITKR